MRGRLNRLLVSLAVLGALTAGPIAVAGPARAASGCTSSGSGGTVITPPTISGGTITFNQAVHVLTSNYCPGQGSSNDSSWTPPACWWQPVFTPQQLKDFAYSYYSDASSADLTWAKMVEYYETDGGKGETTPPGYKSTDGPPYSNWNIPDPAGTWWSIVFNQNMIGTPQFSDCLLHTMNSDGMPWSWVPNGKAGPANVTGPVITREQLAEYLASIIQLPASDFSSSPATGQTVNLPMWVWAGNPGGGPGPYTPQTLTACTVLDPGFCAQVTATAVSFTVDPGTPNNAADAVVYGPCAVNANGTVGTPYTGQAGDPPCGVKYLHSTAQGQDYLPSVTVKWSVAWNGGGGNWPKPDVIPGNTHPVTVQEIQTIVGH